MSRPTDREAGAFVARGGLHDGPPSRKQVEFLDNLATELGYASGKAFARDLLGVDQYGVMKWTKSSVSAAIESALPRLEKLKRLRAQHRGTQTRGRLNAGNGDALK